LATKLLHIYYSNQQRMITIYWALKVSAVLISLILPFEDPRKKKNRGYIALSDWVINEKGELETYTEIEHNSHPIKIRH